MQLKDLTIITATGMPLISLQEKAWESQFLGRKFGQLIFAPSCAADPGFNQSDFHLHLSQLLDRADRAGFVLLEIHFEVGAIALIPLFEELGFRLVDTRISFVTLIDKSLSKKYAVAIGETRFAVPADFAGIIELTHKSFTHNPEFIARFKNRTYFTPAESENYYAKWIENYLEDPETLFAVVENGGRIVAYSFIKAQGQKQGEILYKAILTAVAPDFRGHRTHLALQSFLFAAIPEKCFYFDNTTQLGNYPAIKNHINSKKTLTSVGMVYYRRSVAAVI